jgi:hypothetical protein
MAYQSIVGPFPISFVSEDTGNTATLGMQQQIPLSLIQYDPTQTPSVQITNGPTGVDLQVAQAIVVSLIQQGVLSTAAA